MAVLSVCEWLIPAHAGKTAAASAVAGRPSAHPRSRGENPRTVIEGRALRGSSPLTRGKPSRRVTRNVTLGLIPAHAGKTGQLTVRANPASAHPRSRGENILPALEPLGGVGSSPLTRGKHTVCITEFLSVRLIPAHAGKTTRLNAPWMPTSAHPRSRGENRTLHVWCATRRGSSPLTRGKQVGAGFRRLRGRLIPAHAGKTPVP